MSQRIRPFQFLIAQIDKLVVANRAKPVAGESGESWIVALIFLDKYVIV